MVIILSVKFAAGIAKTMRLTWTLSAPSAGAAVALLRDVVGGPASLARWRVHVSARAKTYWATTV